MDKVSEEGFKVIIALALAMDKVGEEGLGLSLHRLWRETYVSFSSEASLFQSSSFQGSMRQASKGFRAAEEEVMTIFLTVSLLAAAACEDQTALSKECRNRAVQIQGWCGFENQTALSEECQQSGAVQIQDWCELKIGRASLT